MVSSAAAIASASSAGGSTVVGVVAVAVGVCMNMLPTDLIQSNHRGHGHAIAKGLAVTGAKVIVNGRTQSKVDEAVTALDGGQNTPNVQTGFTIITKENLDTFQLDGQSVEQLCSQ